MLDLSDASVIVQAAASRRRDAQCPPGLVGPTSLSFIRSHSSPGSTAVLLPVRRYDRTGWRQTAQEADAPPLQGDERLTHSTASERATDERTVGRRVRELRLAHSATEVQAGLARVTVDCTSCAWRSLRRAMTSQASRPDPSLGRRLRSDSTPLRARESGRSTGTRAALPTHELAR
jgi:hypothetical protein